MFLVGQVLESFNRRVQLLFGFEINFQLLETTFESVPPGMLAEHNAVRCPANILGAHDFICLAFFDDTVLMNAGFMRKGVSPHDRFIGLYRKTGDIRDEARCRNDLGRIEACIARKDILARTHRHDNLLKRGVTRTLAESIDRTFNLSGAMQYGGKAVVDGQSKVVMAVY